MPYRSRRIESHEKSMGSYELHAWSDAVSMAHDLHAFAENNDLTLRDVRRRFEALSPSQLSDLETKNVDLIAQYLQKSERQREAFFTRITKTVDLDAKLRFLVLCILGAVRAKELLELRDQHRFHLAPGSGNRVTIASAYTFADRVAELFVYAWPDEVFDAAGIYVDYSDDEDD